MTSRRALAVSLLTLTCCDAGASSGPAADGGNTAQRAALAACTWSTEACAKNTYSWQASILLRASDLGADARFIAIGGQAVGCTGGANEPKRVARIHTTDEAQHYGVAYKLFPLPSADLDLVDVVDGEVEDERVAVFALACRNASCSLWQSTANDPDGTAMQEIPGSAISSPAPTALIFDAYLKQPCVIAGGLRCFDGAWHEELADKDIRDVAAEKALSLAVGAHGKSWLREPGASWLAQPSDGDVTWTVAAISGKDSFAIGDHGAFKTREASESTICAYPADLAAAPGGILATKQGEVLYNQHDGQRCPIQQLDVGEILDGSITHCRGGNNSWFRSQTTIIGSNYCITAP